MQNEKLQQHMDGAALAAKYHLGVPLKRSTHNLSNAVGIGCAVIFLAFYLLVVLGVVGDIMQQQRVIGWIALLLGVLGLLRLALLFIQANQVTDRSVAYECSEGFVVVSGRGQSEHVLMALRWDEITQAWKEREKLRWRRRSPYGDPYVKYYVRDQHGRQYRLQHRAIWKRCQKEPALRGLSEDRPVV